MANNSLNNVIRLLALITLLAVETYIYLVSTSNDSAELKAKISQLSLVELIIPIILSLTSYLLRFTRWRIILKQLGHKLPLKNDLIFYLSGFALTMTPGKSGETIRSAFLLQVNVPFQTSLSAFVIERSLDLLVVGFIATFLLTPPLLSLMLFLLALICISFVGSRLTLLERRCNKLALPAILLRIVKTFSTASVTLQPAALTKYALLGCAAWVAQGIGFYYIVRLFTEDIDLLSAVSTYCAGLVIGAASLVPGGIGVTEGSLSWILQTQGVDQNSALLSALISRGCTLWLAVAIGCTALTVIIKGKPLPNKGQPKH